MKKVVFYFISFFFLSAFPAFACTSVATPNTVPANSSTTISIAISSLAVPKVLVGFNCGFQTNCSISNPYILPGWSFANWNSGFQNWTNNTNTGTTNITVGADFLWNTTGDKTFDVYGADDTNGTIRKLVR